MDLLNHGAIFDVCDENRNWVRSTIKSRDPCANGTVDCDGNPIEELQVGYRFQDDANVTIGFPEKYDIIRKASLSSV